ncbi:MAG: hypothetical protein ABII89_05640 [Candidatus Omnitrophota bacterium]
MNRKKCSFWPEVKDFFEDEKEADKEDFVPEHLKECRFCRRRLYEERRLTLLLDDLFAAHRNEPVPFLNLTPKLAEVPPKSYAAGFGCPKRFGLLAGGFLLSFLVVLFLFYRPGPIPEPIVPGPILVSNKAPLPIEKSPLPKGEIKIPKTKKPVLTEHKKIAPAAEREEKTAGAGKDFSQVFWSRFYQTVSAIAFPQEIRDLSRIPWPERAET